MHHMRMTKTTDLLLTSKKIGLQENAKKLSTPSNKTMN